jgi:hypothetical protein
MNSYRLLCIYLEVTIPGGGVVNFSQLRRVMDRTTLLDYLKFASLHEDQIDDVHEVLMRHGVTHFDLFFFTDYVDMRQLREWGLLHGTSARLMIHAVLFFQYHVQRQT